MVMVGEIRVPDGTKESRRFVENKVYRRKNFRGSKSNFISETNGSAPVLTDTNTTATTATRTDNAEHNDVRNDEGESAHVPPSQVLDLHDNCSVQKQPLGLTSDDSSCAIRQKDLTASGDEAVAVNGVAKEASRGKENTHVRSVQRRDSRDLKRKLENELDLVRNLVKKIEVRELQLGYGVCSTPGIPTDNFCGNGSHRVIAEMRSASVSCDNNPFRCSVLKRSTSLKQIRSSEMVSNPLTEHVEREKRLPKANPLYRNSEFLLAKDRFPHIDSNKKPKANGRKQGRGEMRHASGPWFKVFRKCGTLLDKLMKHKHGWVFNSPVDVKGLGLHDYYSIIKYPMDLGTVKLRLSRNWYKSPDEFAEDVRLTFHNALTYNPEGQDVHAMASELLKIFEERWAAIKFQYDRALRFASSYTSTIHNPVPMNAPHLQPLSVDVTKSSEGTEFLTPPPLSKSSQIGSGLGRTPVLKKPKAKDVNKRDMTYEEKQKLSTNLQNLPVEKMDGAVQIINRRTSALSQNGEVIEVDIDKVDTETLWELDRFVSNYKKNLSKIRRRAELANRARLETGQRDLPMTALHTQTDVPKEVNNDVNNAMLAHPDKVGDDKSFRRSSCSSSSTTESDSSSSDSDSDSSSAYESNEGS